MHNKNPRLQSAAIAALLATTSLVLLLPAMSLGQTNGSASGLDTGTIASSGFGSTMSEQQRHILQRIFRKDSIVPAFYVAPGGSDNNAGTVRAPFATLGAAQLAMQNSSSIKTTYLRAGTYNVSSTLNLDPNDNGETWMYYPPDGVDTAVLDGGGTVSGGIIVINGASNITINGLKLQHFYDFGIVNGRSTGLESGNVIQNCDVGFNVVTSFSSGGISVSLPNTFIINNYVHDVGSQGIPIYAYYSYDSIDGSVIANNVVLRAVQRMSDGGAIYVNMHAGSQSQHVTVVNNYVRDMGSANTWGVHGIYVDDLASNVTVNGNVVGPPNPASGTGSGSQYGTNAISAFVVNSGNHDVISGNIVDLGSTANVAVVNFDYYSGEPFDVGMVGDTFTGNIVISNFTGSLQANSSGIYGYAYFEGADPAGYSFTIKDNAYWNYADGGLVFSNGQITSDSNPTTENPQLSGWAYTVAPESPVFNAPVCWQGIVGGWGPGRAHHPDGRDSLSRRPGRCRLGIN